MPDTAGNSLATATALNLTSVVQSFQDLVTSTANDYYRFTIAAPSSFSLSLTGLDADANVELLDTSGNPLTVGGVLQRSANTGIFAESLDVVLNPGVYFIRVTPAPTVAIANYTLNVSALTNLLSTDILWQNPVSGDLGLWALNGTNFQSGVLIPEASGLIGWTVDGLGDFNQDGNTDIIWRYEADGSTGIWFMRGTSFLSASVLPAVPGWSIGGTGDFNQDGYTDIAWHYEPTGDVGIWLMKGATFSSAISVGSSGPGWVLSGVEDFNHNGSPDFLWRNRDSGAIGVWFLNQTSFASGAFLNPGQIDPPWVIAGTGDFNRDGKPDILWQYLGPGGGTGIWLMNGLNFSSPITLPSVGLPWRANSPYKTFGSPLPVDIAGNTLVSALDLGKNLSGSASYRDEVGGSTDTDDFFRFNVGSGSRVSLSLTGLTANLDLQLLDSTGALIQSSAQTGLTAESIIGNLAAGTYYIRVLPNTASDRGTYSLGVNINNLPILTTNNPLSVNEEGSGLIGSNLLKVTDGDHPATQLTYTLGSLPGNGTLSVNGVVATLGTRFSQADLDNGTRLRYIHNGSETSSDRFNFTVSDGAGGILDVRTFSIVVNPVNDAPVLTVPGTQQADQGANILIPPIQATDVDLGTGEMTVTLSAANGLLTLGRTTGVTFLVGTGRDNPTISFRATLDVANFVLQSLLYRSNATFQGTDTITVTVNDGGNTGLGGAKSDTELISVQVASVNDPPIITVPGLQTIPEDVTSPISGISVADPDANTGLLTVSLTVTNGTFSLVSVAGITLVTGTGRNDKNLVFRGTLGNINTALNGLTYLGDRNFNGTDTLTISVSDNGNTGNGIPLSDTKTISLNVTAQNDPPVLSLPSAQSINENTTLSLTGMSVSDVDVGAGNLTVSLVVANGRLSFGSLNGLSFTSGDGTQDPALVFTGKQADVNEALKTLIYQPNSDFSGSDTVSVNVSDGGNTGAGLASGVSGTVPITILGINNPPIITLPTTPGVASNTDIKITGINVSDPDVGGNLLSVTLQAENGILSLKTTAGLTFSQGDGTQDSRITFSGSLFAIKEALSELTYRSYPGFSNGFDRITISVNDNGNTGIGVALSDTKTLFVNVGNAVNLVPIAQNDSYSVAEEGTLNGTTVLSNDSDPDFTLPLTAQLVAGPTNAATFNLNPNGTFTYNPVVNFNGTDSFTYTTRDALGGVSNTATVIINVTPTNDAPIANPDTFTSAEDQLLNGNVLTNDTDVDNPVASLSAQLIAGPANALSFTFNPNGSFSYTPNLNYNGSDRITYVAIDPLGGRSNTATVSLAITPVNDAPIANNDGVYSVGAGGTLSVSATSGVLRNDTDIDSPSLSASVVTNPLNGTVSLNADGSFTYRPTGSFTGTDSFTYRASDGSLTSNLATVTISVATNNLPIANPDTFTTLEDTPLTTGNVLSNDTDPDNNTPLTASLVTQAIRGSVNLNQNGTFTYTPNTNLNGVDSFTYRAIDRLGGTSSLATVTFSVTPVNDAPIANNDGIYTVSAGGTLSVAIATGVLSNDTDVDIPSQTLTATTVLGPSNGTVTLNADGSFTYRPTGSFAGIDSFTYRVSDGSLTSNLATVTISVGTNNAPVASPDLFTTAEDTLLTTGNVLSNDTDTDNNLPLTASLVTQAVNGSVSLNQDGTFSYLPRLNFSGVDSFTYIARDSLGANSSPATVTFSVAPVNDAPVAGNNTLSVSPGGTLSIAPTTLLANDSDVDNLSLSIVSVSATANGSLTLNPNGTFTYQSNAGFTGSDSFTYRASDGTLTSNLATVTLVVDPAANNAPIATPDTFTTAEDTTLTIGNVLANDSDIDNNLPLTASLVTGPTNSLSFALNSNGTFSYVPRLNFNGTDSFTYIARDSLGANSGLVTVTLSVTPVNDAPISGNDSFTIATTTTLNITTPGVLTNDSDVDSPFLSATVVSQPQGTLSLNPDGSFIYRPQTGFSGIDSFTYRANDGSLNATATVNITVTLPPNVLPIANPDVFTFPEDTSLTTGNVLTNDTDSDGNLPLTASLVTGPTNSVSFALNSDGTFSYVPRLNFNGTDSFTYVTRDSRGGASNTATVTLSVTPVNDAPIANNDTLSVIPGSSLNIAQATLLANDTDVDNTTLSVVTVSTTSFGSLSLNLDGSFTYRPNTGFTGTDSFTYRANDGNLSSANTATVTLVVTPTANNVPIALTDTFTTTEDTTLTNGNVLANDTDIDGHLPLTASLVSGPTNSVSFALNSDGTFTYVPRLNFNGVDSFTYVARDSLGATSGLATVTLSVTTVNDPPVANNDTLTLASGSSLSIVPATLLANDTDVDSTTLSVVSVSATAFGSLTFNPDGTFTYRPNTGFSGTDSFTYRASDGTVSSTNSATVLLSVTVAPNILPIANPDTFTTLEDTSLTVGNVLANDSDPDNNTPLTASLVTQALRGSVTLNTNGTFTYIPNANSNGVDSFTYRAIDSRGGSSTATVTFSVTPVNDLPVATNDTVTVNAGSVLTLTLPGVLANDTDLDGNSLTANLINNVTNGNLVLNGNGSLTYTPTAGFFGSDRFTYVANDGTGNSNTATVSIRVNALPTAQSEAYSVIVNTPLVVNQIQGVLANDTDPDGDSLTASLVNQAGQGNVVLNPNGSFTYTPNAGATGTDTFVYRATDGLANTTATVTLSIRANTPPVANPDPLYRAATNGTLSVAVLNSVLSNDTDAETPNGLTAISVSSTSQGSLNLNSNGTFVYIPQAGFQGTDSFVYRASDGVALSNPVTVSISVSPNTPPVANPNFYSFSDPTLSVVAINGVLTNDSDVDGNPLVASVVTNPARGTLTLNPDGSFVYTPQAGFQGTDSFTYRAFDGIASSTATVSLSVIVNQAPIAQPDVYSAIAGQTLTVTAPGVLANDTDPDGQTLSALGGATQPGNGQLLNFNADGSFVYLPNAGFIGLDSFTYRASDNLSETLQTVTISVTTNGAPIANPDVYSVNQNNLLAISRTAGVLANDTDPNAQSLSATIVSTTNQGSLSLNPDGSFVYTPNAGASGTDSFTYRATDGSFNSTAIVTLSLKSTSTPPIAQNDGGYSVATNSSLNISATNGVLKNDSDPDGDLIRASVVTSPISGGTVTLNANGSFVYQPGTGFQGTDSFTYRATDGLTNSTATVFVTVGGANAAPVVTTPGNQLIAQNTELLIPSGISIADPDAGNNPIQITLSATNGTLTLAGITGLTFTTGDGTADATMTFTGTVAAINTALQNLRFNPTTGFSGAAQITLVANDQGNSGSGGAQTGSGTVTVNVSSGATLVTNINPGSGNASPNNLVSAGNTVFFAATNSGGTELFKSDGTATNTIRVADINLTGSSSPRNLTVIGNTLYFTATNGTLGEELWKTDLTTGTGATLVKDIRSGLSSSSPRNLVNLNGTLFLIATDGSAGGSQLFKSDGTDANTVKVGAGYTNAGNPTVVGNALYFTANNGTQIWKTDGTNAGTVLVKDLGTGGNIANLTAVGNILYFAAKDSNGVELWSSDGTTANTNRVADLNPGAGDANPTNLVNLNGTLYFVAQDNTNTFRLFQKTGAGSVSAGIVLPSGGQPPTSLTVVGNKLFFVVDAGTAASPSLQLWSSDGTTAALVKDINATGNDAIASLTSLNGSLFFVANDGTGFKVFRSDGSATGTVAVSGNFTTAPTNLAAVGNKLYFAGSDTTNGSELWVVQ